MRTVATTDDVNRATVAGTARRAAAVRTAKSRRVADVDVAVAVAVDVDVDVAGWRAAFSVSCFDCSRSRSATSPNSPLSRSARRRSSHTAPAVPVLLSGELRDTRLRPRSGAASW